MAIARYATWQNVDSSRAPSASEPPQRSTVRPLSAEVILTSRAPGFDELAAALLAARLYPGAVVVEPTRLSSCERAFLALHRDRFRLTPAARVTWDCARRIVLVGTRRPAELEAPKEVLARAAARDPGLELHVYARCAAVDDELAGASEVVGPAAALSTLVVEAIRRRDETLGPVEATLAAIGLHARTSSFTGADTTARDAAAYAWALSQGANLRVVSRYLHPVLKPAQRLLLAQIVDNVVVETVHGVEVGFAEVPLARPVEQLVALTEEVFRIEGLGALFAAYAIRGNVRVVGCSRSPVVHVGRALAKLGGTGSAGRGWAVVDGEAAAVGQRLHELVRETTSRPLLVADIMSSPVRTVAPDAPMQSLRDSLQAWGCTGAPVVEGGELVGVVSRRDVERAEREGALGEPVQKRMSQSPKVTTPEASLEAALEIMVAADIGRLPVLREGKVVGIVSRTDVLRVLYARGGTARREG